MGSIDTDCDPKLVRSTVSELIERDKFANGLVECMQTRKCTTTDGLITSDLIEAAGIPGQLIGTRPSERDCPLPILHAVADNLPHQYIDSAQTAFKTEVIIPATEAISTEAIMPAKQAELNDACDPREEFADSVVEDHPVQEHKENINESDSDCEIVSMMKTLEVNPIENDVSESKSLKADVETMGKYLAKLHLEPSECSDGEESDSTITDDKKTCNGTYIEQTSIGGEIRSTDGGFQTRAPVSGIVRPQQPYKLTFHWNNSDDIVNTVNGVEILPVTPGKHSRDEDYFLPPPRYYKPNEPVEHDERNIYEITGIKTEWTNASISSGGTMSIGSIDQDKLDEEISRLQMSIDISLKQSGSVERHGIYTHQRPVMTPMIQPVLSINHQNQTCLNQQAQNQSNCQAQHNVLGQAAPGRKILSPIRHMELFTPVNGLGSPVHDSVDSFYGMNLPDTCIAPISPDSSGYSTSSTVGETDWTNSPSNSADSTYDEVIGSPPASYNYIPEPDEHTKILIQAFDDVLKQLMAEKCEQDSVSVPAEDIVLEEVLQGVGKNDPVSLKEQEILKSLPLIQPKPVKLAVKEPVPSVPLTVNQHLPVVYHKNVCARIEVRDENPEEYLTALSYIAQRDKIYLTEPDSDGDYLHHVAVKEHEYYILKAVLARYKRMGILEKLIDKQAQNQTALYMAMKSLPDEGRPNHQLQMVKVLLDFGADVNIQCQERSSSGEPFYQNVIHLAASRNRLDFLEEFMRMKNIKFNERNSFVEAPIHCAIKKHQISWDGTRYHGVDCRQVLRRLKEAGADFRQQTKMNKSVLQQAIDKFDPELVMYILDLTRDEVQHIINLTDDQEDSILHSACGCLGQLPEHKFPVFQEMIRRLIKLGVDTTWKNSQKKLAKNYLPPNSRQGKLIEELLANKKYGNGKSRRVSNN